MESNLSYRALIALTVTSVMAGAAAAKGSPEEIEKLGKSLTCIGAEKAGTASGAVATPAPTSSTMPMNSCPSTSPGDRKGASTLYRCRSEPQIAVDVTRTIASVGSWMCGSGTSVMRTSSMPCQVSAFMGCHAMQHRSGSSSPAGGVWAVAAR